MRYIMMGTQPRDEEYAHGRDKDEPAEGPQGHTGSYA